MNRLKWFGHSIRREKTEAVRVMMRMNVEVKRERKDGKRRSWIRLKIL